MRLVAANSSKEFIEWLRERGYPDLDENWGVGLLDACFKYAAYSNDRQDATIYGVVWYHWGTYNSLVVHMCSQPGLYIFDRQLMGDFYKVAELLGASQMIAHVDAPRIVALAKFAGWTANEHGSYIIDLPSPWARYDPGVKGQRDGQHIRGRREGRRHFQAGSQDPGGPQEGSSREAGPREPEIGTIGTAAPGA